MINRYKYRDTSWIDLVKPEASEIRDIMAEFNINPDVASELTSPSVKSRADLYDGFLYVILQFPAFKHSHSENVRQEVDFIIGKNFVITARYDTVDPIDKFAKMLEVSTILHRNDSADASSVIFFGILQEIYKAISHELSFTEEWVDKVEDEIFKGKEREMVVSLSHAARMLLNFKKMTDFHENVLNSLEMYGEKIFGNEFPFYIRSTKDEYMKIQHMIKSNMASVVELRETNNSLLSTKQNEIMKTFTILAFVTFPLTLIAGIFGMNTKSMPLIGDPNDFWMVLGIMLAATIVLFSYFKYKKWL